MNIFKWILILTMVYSNQVAAKECVILLHGLARSNSSMEKLAKALTDAGYFAINDGYPSTQYKIDKLAKDAIGKALTKERA